MSHDGEGPTRIVGPLTVRASSADLAAFDAATNFHVEAGHKGTRATVPLSYLPTLLGHPSVKPLVMEALRELGGHAHASHVHVKQEVTIHHPLEPDRPYSLILNCRRHGAKFIQIAGEISDPGAGPVAQMQSEFLVAQAGDIA